MLHSPRISLFVMVAMVSVLLSIRRWAGLVTAQAGLGLAIVIVVGGSVLVSGAVLWRWIADAMPTETREARRHIRRQVATARRLHRHCAGRCILLHDRRLGIREIEMEHLVVTATWIFVIKDADVPRGADRQSIETVARGLGLDADELSAQTGCRSVGVLLLPHPRCSTRVEPVPGGSPVYVTDINELIRTVLAQPGDPTQCLRWARRLSVACPRRA